MKVSYSWLKERLPLSVPAKDLADHLLRLGLEVASIEKRGPDFTGVVTAHVLEVAKHPNADRLNLCVVDDGSQKLNVVCGAPNVAAGQKVALARVGAVLPGNFKIGKSKIRGVESNGMICSAKELALPEANGGGIMVLSADTPLGMDFASRLGEADEIMEVEVTPNRPDCLSHLGLARELSAYFRIPLKDTGLSTASFPGKAQAKISVEDKAACPRYTGRVIENVDAAPSPAWLAQKLEAVGLRPINAVVDVTNFVLMDLGQPLHAFDLDKLEGGEVKVRWAKKGETLKALDGKDYALTPEILVIADAKKPVAIAGVMGGLETGVTEKTRRVLLESAYFNPVAVRKAGQLLRLRSDSSYRFERGVDPEAALNASGRAAELIAKLCKGAVVSEAVEASAERPARPVIEISAARVNKILGSEFPPEEIERALKAIAQTFEPKGEGWLFRAPSWRGDLDTPWDLAEEAARLLSYDAVPAKAGPVAPKPARLTRLQEVTQKAKQRLASLGLFEAYNYDFVSEKRLGQARLAEGPGAVWARLANPLSEDWTVLRPSLLPGLLENARTNLNRGAVSVRLFEVGTVYDGSKPWPEERVRLAGVLLGPVSEPFWKPARTPRADLYDALGLILDVLSGVELSRAPLSATKAPRPDDAVFSPASSVELSSPRGRLGAVGLLHPQAARAFDLEREGAVIFDLDLQSLSELESSVRKQRPVSAFPAAKRDLSVLVDAKTPFAAVEGAAREAGKPDLSTLELIDVFTGKGVPEGKHSLTMSLSFSKEDRTITDADVNAAMERIVSALKAKTGAELRG